VGEDEGKEGRCEGGIIKRCEVEKESSKNPNRARQPTHHTALANNVEPAGAEADESTGPEVVRLGPGVKQMYVAVLRGERLAIRLAGDGHSTARAHGMGQSSLPTGGGDAQQPKG